MTDTEQHPTDPDPPASPDEPVGAARTVAAPVDIGRRMFRQWQEDRVPGVAAEVAFYAVLSIFPSLLALTAALGFLESVAGTDVADDARSSIVDWLQRVLGGEASGTVDTVEELFDSPSPGLLTFGLVTVVWTASRVFASLIRALDVVYDLEERRTWLGIRATGLALAFGSFLVGALVLTMTLVGPLFGRGADLADDLGFGDLFVTLWTWARPPFVLAVTIAWATTVFHVAPNHKTPWRWDLPGAALTTLLWLVGTAGFRLYLEIASSDANLVFGVLGGALTLMLWMYVLALSVLVGGELNAVLTRRYDVERRVTTERRAVTWARQQARHRFRNRRGASARRAPDED